MPSTLDRLVLSFPSLIQLAAKTGGDVPSSWIQLATTGAFQSSRYGQFDITPDDLRMMVANFEPSVTPIDYDHLSMEVTKPGDGIAAGWLQRVELRDDGQTLWGLVAWTAAAERRIRDREYRFISPSFMKNYATPTGKEVGTKLLAAALTNLPFLPNMAAVTLGSDSVFGQFALSLPSKRTLHLAEVGQRVRFRMETTAVPELTDHEREVTYTVSATDGGAFARLTDAAGREFGWFHTDQLAPADPVHQETPMPSNPVTDLRAALSKLEADVVSLTKDHATLAPPRETFDALALRLSQERGIDLRAAIHLAGVQRPDLAAQRP